MSKDIKYPYSNKVKIFDKFENPELQKVAENSIMYQKIKNPTPEEYTQEIQNFHNEELENFIAYLRASFNNKQIALRTKFNLSYYPEEFLIGQHILDFRSLVDNNLYLKNKYFHILNRNNDLIFRINNRYCSNHDHIEINFNEIYYPENLENLSEGSINPIIKSKKSLRFDKGKNNELFLEGEPCCISNLTLDSSINRIKAEIFSKTK